MRDDREKLIINICYGTKLSFHKWYDGYSGVKSKVVLKCVIHGDWIVNSDSFVRNKSNCPKCSFENRIEPETNVLIKLEHALTDTIYTFKGWVGSYIGSSSRLVLHCEKHGDWESRLNTFLRSGSRCRKCAHDNMTISEIDRTKIITEYAISKGYSFVKWVGEYSGSNSRVIINCVDHGDWECRSSSFIDGHHCMGCSVNGYDKSKKGYLYILRSDCCRFFKIGITNNTTRRLRELKNRTPFEFKKHTILCFEDGNVALQLETALHRSFKKANFKEFDGATEWFIWSSEVITWVNYLLQDDQ